MSQWMLPWQWQWFKVRVVKNVLYQKVLLSILISEMKFAGIN